MQSILAGVITAAFTAIPVLILTKLTGSKNKCVKIFGLIIAMAIYLICVFIIITAAALIGVDDSNIWMEEYFTAFMLDNLAI